VAPEEEEEDLGPPVGDYSVFLAKKSPTAVVGMQLVIVGQTTKGSGKVFLTGIAKESLLDTFNSDGLRDVREDGLLDQFGRPQHEGEAELSDVNARIGDRVLSVNDEYKDADKMLRLIMSEENITMAMQHAYVPLRGNTSVRIYRPHVHRGKCIGLVCERDTRNVGLDSGFLQVTKVEPGSYMDEWNKDNPSQEVKRGDRVMIVCGETTAAIMASQLKTETILVIEMCRVWDADGERIRAEMIARMEAARLEKIRLEEERVAEEERLRRIKIETERMLKIRAGYQDVADSHIKFEFEIHKLEAQEKDKERSAKLEN